MSTTTPDVPTVPPQASGETAPGQTAPGQTVRTPGETLPAPVTSEAAVDVRTAVDSMIAERSARTTLALESWPRAELDAFTDEALALSVRHARQSLLYQTKLAGYPNPDGRADLTRLPFTGATEVKGSLSALLACPWDDVAQVNLSSGTTAGPTTYVAYTEEDLRGDGGRYGPDGLFAFDRSDLVAVALPYDMATVGLSIHRDVRRQGAAVLPAGKGGSYGPPERLVQAIAELGVTTLFSTPSFAWYMADLFGAAYPGLEPPVRHLRVGGEGASPAMLASLSDRWKGTDVRQWFGSTEVGVIAYSCEHGVYHLAAGNCHAEVVDGGGEHVPAGTTGSLVLTSLGRVATPVVRYCTGDRAMLLADPCPCGRTLPPLRVLGRSADQLDGARGPVSPYLVEHALLTELPEAAPWYHLAKRPRGPVLVAEWPEDVDPSRQRSVARAVIERATATGGLRLAGVEWAAVGTLDRPRTKMRRVRDERVETPVHDTHDGKAGT